MLTGAMMATQLRELKEMLLTLAKELQEARADVRWLQKRMFEVCDMGPKRAVVTLTKSAQFGEMTTTLTAWEWDAVRNGENLRKCGDGQWRDDEFYCWDYWEFKNGIGGSVTLSVKFDDDDDFEVAFTERLFGFMVEEFDEVLQ
jgi:hypothetical protein